MVNRLFMASLVVMLWPFLPNAARAAGEPSAAQPDLATLARQYGEALAPISAESYARLQKLKLEYEAALGDLQKSIMSDGDLDGSLAVKAELDRVGAGADPSDDERSRMPGRLKSLRDTYEKGRAKIRADRTAKEQTLAAQYTTNLGILEKRLTAQGDLNAAIAVREERDRVSGVAPPVEKPAPPQDTVEPWARQWVIVDNWTEPGQPLNPGTVLDSVWASGDMAPGQYRNTPFYEGPGKRTGILALHPATPERPATLRREGVVDPAKSVLQVVAGGNAAGDCLLQCFAGGQKVGEYVLDGSGWKTCAFDLSRVAGRKSSVELRIAAGGKDAWHFEHGFIDEISFVSKNAQGVR